MSKKSLEEGQRLYEENMKNKS